MAYKLKLWNGRYGNPAKFIAEDEEGRMTEFSPARPKDVAWVKQDLTKDPSYKEWQSFEDEPVDDLNAIVM